MSRRLLTFQRKFDGYKRSKLLPSWLASSLAPFHPLYLGYYHVEFVEHRQRPCTPHSYSLFFRSSLYPFVPETTLFMPNEHVGERCSFQPRLDNFSTFFPPSPSPRSSFFCKFFYLLFFNAFHSTDHADQGPRGKRRRRNVVERLGAFRESVSPTASFLDLSRIIRSLPFCHAAFSRG